MIYLSLFLSFFKVGLFTFGGGYAMLPLISSEVLANGWMTEREIVDFIAVSESTPGPFAVNVSTYVGAETAGVFGAFMATFGVVLPSFLVIIIVAKFFVKFKNSTAVVGCMTGLKPAVIGLIAAAALSVGREVFIPEFSNSKFTIISLLTDIQFISSVVIFIIMVILIIKKLHPILIIGISAILGILTGYLF